VFTYSVWSDIGPFPINEDNKNTVHNPYLLPVFGLCVEALNECTQYKKCNTIYQFTLNVFTQYKKCNTIYQFTLTGESYVVGPVMQ